MKIRDTYHYIPWPYLSKSSYKTWKACKYKFKRAIIDKLDMGKNKIMAEGTTLHFMYYTFFEIVDFNKLYSLDWSLFNGTKQSAVYQYFYSLLMDWFEDYIPNKHMTSNIRAFCMLEENHYIHLRVKYKSKRSIKNYFMANVEERELFLRNDIFRIFGTVDRIIKEETKTIISDYKTGNVPKKLREEIREGVYTKVKMTHYVVEGNFYVLLYMLRIGYTLEEDKNGKLWFYKDGKLEKDAHKLFDYAFIFTGEFTNKEPVYYVARKTSSMVSIRTVVKNLTKIREWKDWKREPNLMRCRWCQLYLTECKEIVPIEIFGDLRGGQDTP